MQEILARLLDTSLKYTLANRSSTSGRLGSVVERIRHISVAPLILSTRFSSA
ncbi:unnamed protein product [Brugia timori]|uniref:Uncharacterized protein n=1 Tax=Brugia timori TaxID=42155 RepID=A0A0R3RCI2_9BILA|nr:unnamed protein product [Brugia timori]